MTMTFLISRQRLISTFHKKNKSQTIYNKDEEFLVLGVTFKQIVNRIDLGAGFNQAVFFFYALV